MPHTLLYLRFGVRKNTGKKQVEFKGKLYFLSFTFYLFPFLYCIVFLFYFFFALYFSFFISIKLSMIVWVNVILSRTVVDSD